MPKLVIRFKTRGTFKTRSDEREFLRLVERATTDAISGILGGFPNVSLRNIDVDLRTDRDDDNAG